MEYLYATILICLILWIYYRIKYKSSGYNKFEYYLTGEINWFITFIVMLTEILITISLEVLLVVIIAQGIKFLI